MLGAPRAAPLSDMHALWRLRWGWWWVSQNLLGEAKHLRRGNNFSDLKTAQRVFLHSRHRQLDVAAFKVEMTPLDMLEMFLRGMPFFT